MTAIFLPDPDAKIGNRNFWRRRSVREYLAAVSGYPAPEPQPDDEFLMGSLELRMALGGVSDMWILRHSRPRRSSERPPAVPSGPAVA